MKGSVRMYLNIDIKKDSVFKNIYLREEGRLHMCKIISNLYNLDYKDLVYNMKIYNTEHPRINGKYGLSYSDIVYEYKNMIFIIEMNKSYYEKIIYKNHFYLFFRHIFDANNKNGYNKNKETITNFIMPLSSLKSFVLIIISKLLLTLIGLLVCSGLA